MPDSSHPRFVSGSRQWSQLALALLVVGPSVLLIYAWVEVLNHPGLSLVDGYWIGRLPWTAIGIVTSLAGGVLGLLAGSVAIAIEGGWWRRALLVPAFIAAALWWLTALGVIPYPRFTGPDPVAFAYDLPSTAALLVLMPAALLAVLALTPPQPRPAPMQLRPVPAPQPRADALSADEEVEPVELQE